MGSIDSAGFSINPPLICLKMISPIRLTHCFRIVRAINNTINRFSMDSGVEKIRQQ
jgi:hypothetical protein